MNTERFLMTSALVGAVLVGACSKGDATGTSSGEHTTEATSGTTGTTTVTGPGGPGSTATSGGTGGASNGGAPTTATTTGTPTGTTTTVTSAGTGGSFTSGNGATVTGAGTGGGDGVSVQWTAGCWENYMGVNYQAMEFQYSAPMELPIEATLFYNATCDPSDGTDNLNDFNTPTPFGPWIEWFIHHPGEQNTSAIWSFGNHSTGCVNYNNAPPCM